MLVIIKIITSIIYIIDTKNMVGDIKMETTKDELKNITNQLDKAWEQLSYIRGQYEVYERNNDIEKMTSLKDKARWYDGVYYGVYYGILRILRENITDIMAFSIECPGLGLRLSEASTAILVSK